MGWFTNFVSELTGDSSSKTSSTHHQARDDSGVREGRDKENFKSPPDWAEKTTPVGSELFPSDKR